MKTFISILCLVCIGLTTQVSPVLAVENEAGSAAMLVSRSTTVDPRVRQLQGFLGQYNPELAPFASEFVSEADTYGLDWKMVAAISGLESTFCNRIPQGSYNCWGWGIPTGSTSGIGFTSFSDGIHQVSQGLRHDYVDRGLFTIEKIGSRYAASPTWATRVRFYMQKIETYTPNLSRAPEFSI